jgi:hypothetical protein
MEINSREIVKLGLLPMTIAQGAARVAIEAVVGNDTSRNCAKQAVEARRSAEKELRRRFPLPNEVQAQCQDVTVDLISSEQVVPAEAVPEQAIDSIS